MKILDAIAGLFILGFFLVTIGAAVVGLIQAIFKQVESSNKRAAKGYSSSSSREPFNWHA